MSYKEAQMRQATASMQDMRRIGRPLLCQPGKIAARPEEGTFKSSAESYWFVGSHCSSRPTLTELSATLESQSDRRRPEPSLEDVSDDAEQCQQLSFDDHAVQATSPPQKRAIDIAHGQSLGAHNSFKETSAKAPTILPAPEMSDMVEADLYVKPIH